MDPQLPFSPNYLATNRLKGSPLTRKEKDIIINVYCYFRREDPESKISDIVEEVHRATLFSIASIYRIKDEYTKSNFHGTPIKDGRKKCKKYQKHNSRTYDNFIMSAIRNKVHRDFFQKNEPPTLKKIHAAIRQDTTLPNLCISTVNRILKELGFVYSTRNRNSVLIERPEITEWRHNYLRKIKNYRQLNNPIIYTDETWVNAGHT